VSNFALHYIKNTDATLTELYRVLKRGGMLVAVFGDAQFTERHEALRDTPLPLKFKNAMQVTALAKDAERVREEAQRAGFTIEDFHRLPQEVSIATVPDTYTEQGNVTIGIARIVARKA
jgi:ubiquinone/menaquinone biosynthesis C-methylase UbiE